MMEAGVERIGLNARKIMPGLRNIFGGKSIKWICKEFGGLKGKSWVKSRGKPRLTMTKVIPASCDRDMNPFGFPNRKKFDDACKRNLF